MLKDGCWNECHGQDYESEDKTKTRKHEQIFGFSGLRLGGDECWRRTHIRSGRVWSQRPKRRRIELSNLSFRESKRRDRERSYWNGIREMTPLKRGVVDTVK